MWMPGSLSCVHTKLRCTYGDARGVDHLSASSPLRSQGQCGMLSHRTPAGVHVPCLRGREGGQCCAPSSHHIRGACGSPNTTLAHTRSPLCAAQNLYTFTHCKLKQACTVCQHRCEHSEFQRTSLPLPSDGVQESLPSCSVFFSIDF